MTTTRRNRQPSARAFSLIELMIVILIIAMIIAIVVPALGHTRANARNQATKNLMVQVEQSCSSFQISERRLPGYFSARELGSAANGTNIGFTGMENVMFDLAGGVVGPGTAPQPTGSPASFLCGPGSTPAGQVWYDGDKVGLAEGTNKAYFTPPSKHFKKQDQAEGLGAKLASANNTYVRDLVDAEGTPILLWAVDPMSVQPIQTEADFAAVSSPAAAAASPARYYWNSNAAFLRSPSCGDKRTNQIDPSLGSLLGNATPPASNSPQVLSMLGVLGNPSSPKNLTPPAGEPILPTAGRGAFILQAAGTNAKYVGKEERGGKTATGGNTLDYSLNFRTNPSSDVMHDFDDILVAGGS